MGIMVQVVEVIGIVKEVVKLILVIVVVVNNNFCRGYCCCDDHQMVPIGWRAHVRYFARHNFWPFGNL